MLAMRIRPLRQLKCRKCRVVQSVKSQTREFVDVETAKAAGRTGFGEMIACLKENSSRKAILVEKTDRLYRNLRDWVTIDELDIEVHLVKENVVLSKGSRSH
jgi:DNA invertase Pin-like site-specific DNA recombinase